MIQGIYFDYGGVLSPGGITKISKEVPAKYFGIKVDEIDVEDIDTRLQAGDISLGEYFDLTSRRYGKGQPPLQEDTYVEMADIFVKNEKVYGMAARIRESGILTGILSNVTFINSTLLRARGYYDGFDPIVLSCDTGVRKPEMPIYIAALSKAGMPADEVLFVDDKETCLEPARMLGMQVMLAMNEIQVVDTLRSELRKQNGLKL
ncbi:MAG TPA: HAD-IA family hydrolase [Candidatus Saccharimonadales bacterium]|nr:HAD-IA family hydrolase [Candidatus Saccharimonadales bacterium]